MLGIKRTTTAEEYYELDEKSSSAEINTAKIDQPSHNKKVKSTTSHTSVYKDYNVKETYQTDIELVPFLINPSSPV